MPEYLAPGVYVEEIPNLHPIAGVGTSTVGFVGIAERGPMGPRLITSVQEYGRWFGGYLREGGQDRYLTYALDGFFLQGGKQCYIARVASKAATSAACVLDGVIRVQAIGPGAWGDRVSVEVVTPSSGASASASMSGAKPFRLIVRYWASGVPGKGQPTVQEYYDHLSATSGAAGSTNDLVMGASCLVTINWVGAAGRPADSAPILLQGGSDGPGSAGQDFKDALDRLEGIDEISLLCAPDENQFPCVTGYLVDQCEKLRDRFAILQAPCVIADIAQHHPPRDSTFGAYYLPWLRIQHPETKKEQMIPPGGHLAGIYAKTDNDRGVHKAPANEMIRGLLVDSQNQGRGLAVQVSMALQNVLNPRGINVLRCFPVKGYRVWGARTMSADQEWRYITVRRLAIFLEQSIVRGLQWVVFEPNQEPSWAQVRRSIDEFLTGVWRKGMLQGVKPEAAFFVKCDATTMTQDDIAQGRLIALVGIAPLKPAEFIIFKVRLRSCA